MIPTDSILAASEFDKTISLKNINLLKLKHRCLAPQVYTKKKLFDAMFYGKTIVFSNYPIQNPVSAEKDKTSLTTVIFTIHF